MLARVAAPLSAVRVDRLAQVARPAPISAVPVAWVAWPQAAPADTLVSAAASSVVRAAWAAWPRVEPAAAGAPAARPAPISAVRMDRLAQVDLRASPWAAQLARVAPAAAPLAEAIRSRTTLARQRSCVARAATVI